MFYKKKAEVEKEFVDMIITKGGINCYCCMTNGKNKYYHLELKNGEVRWWTNFSSESLKRLKIKEG